MKSLNAIVLLAFLCAATLPAQNLDFDALSAQDEFRRGVRAFHRGSFHDAILTFKKSLSYKADDWLVRTWLGRAYYHAGFEEAALGELRQVKTAGRSSAWLDQFIEAIEIRRSVQPELSRSDPERWILSAAVERTVGNSILFQRPATVRTRHDGMFYVVAFASNEILLMDPNGVIRRRLRGGLGGFDNPFDLAIASDGAMFVSEFRGDRIAVLSPEGEKITTFGRRGRGEGEFFGPQYLCVDDEDNVYVSDWGNRRISKFNREGQFLFSFGQRTANFEGLIEPTGLAFHAGYLYVADAARRKLFVFDRHGNPVGELLAGRLERPEGMRVQRDGRILISDARRVLAFDPERESLTELTRFESPRSRVLTADIDVNGTMLAADFDAETVYFMTEMSGLYTGLAVQINRVYAEDFPIIHVDVSVFDRDLRPITALTGGNFAVSEGRIPVLDMELVQSASTIPVVEVAVLLETSPATAGAATQAVLRDLYTRLQGQARLRLVAASRVPALISGGEIRAALAAASRAELSDPRWALDLGIRQAAVELSGVHARRAIVFVGSGSLHGLSFATIGLQETANFLRTNSIAFFAVNIGAGRMDGALEFLAAASGGRSYSFPSPRSLNDLPADLAALRAGTYVLRYRSPTTRTDFGRRYIPLEVEAVLVKRTGRDELGYFAPLSFTRP